MAVLVPCGAKIRAQVDALNPRRDRSSDGWIGDPAHASTSSDHNPDETGTVPVRDADRVDEVHAIDVDETGPWPGDSRGPWSVMRLVRQLVADSRAGRERRLRYVIYESTIWSASWDWTAREYVGTNPHDKHVHLSFSYDSVLESDVRPWNIGFEEEDVFEDLDRRKLGDLHHTVTQIPDGRGGRVPLHVAVSEMRSDLAALRQAAVDDGLRDDRLTGELAALRTLVAEVRDVLDRHASGQLSANAVVDEIAARLRGS